MGDEIFDRLPGELGSKLANEPVVASDLARLIVLQEALAEGIGRAIWVDADVFVINPRTFELPAADALFGREVWVQQHGDNGRKLKTYRRIHNAFMAFVAGEPVLPFYRMSAERILSRYEAGSGPMVPQLIGPKLLTLLHNAIGFDVLEEAGMLSPLVALDLLAGGGSALDRYLSGSAVLPQAINLCGSSVRNGELTDEEVAQLIGQLETSGLGC